jgi:hypothetical protein
MKIYKTSDFGNACVISTVGYRLKSIEDGERNNKIFIFEDDGGIERVLIDFMNDELVVKAKKFYDIIKSFKSLVKS